MRSLALLILLLAAVPVAPAEPFVRTEERAPCADHNPLRNAYFGDLHVHTALSLDAATQGTINRPRDAYRFARGERLGIQPYDREGTALRHLQLDRPLDFAAVTDHAELFGELALCQTPASDGYSSPVCIIYRRWPRLAFFLMNSRSANSEAPVRYGFCGPGGALCLEAARTPWHEIQRAAEEAYDTSPSCSFTTFVGYEWTGAPGSNNLHRNVIFRNAVVPNLPVSHFDAPQPAELWRQLRAGCLSARPGCDVLTVPHNSNLSGGLMFETVDAEGKAISAEYVAERARFEPLVEVMQHKGDSECLPEAGVQDELCGFEKLPYTNFAGNYMSWAAKPPDPASFVRNALLEGLVQEERLGANPFKYGLVASTDTHLAAAGAVSEESYPGHGGAGTPAGSELPPGLPDDIEFNPGGLAVLWAEENSRDALFAAMRRREAYGTSGPRLNVRFFGGWSYAADLCDRPDFVAAGYAGGVPMGGGLAAPRSGAGGAPRFAVSALRDPGTAARPGTPLQRVQIVKGWIEGGTTKVAVYEVAGEPENGAGVDLATCAPTGGGFDSLCAVWKDPDFEPSEPAFYYARVVENPTCRWSTYACNAGGVDCARPETIGKGFEPCCDPTYPKTVQERAWTSPIWYAPQPNG